MRDATERWSAERIWDARERIAQVLYELGKQHAQPDADGLIYGHPGQRRQRAAARCRPAQGGGGRLGGQGRQRRARAPRRAPAKQRLTSSTYQQEKGEINGDSRRRSPAPCLGGVSISPAALAAGPGARIAERTRSPRQGPRQPPRVAFVET